VNLVPFLFLIFMFLTSACFSYFEIYIFHTYIHLLVVLLFFSSEKAKSSLMCACVSVVGGISD